MHERQTFVGHCCVPHKGYMHGRETFARNAVSMTVPVLMHDLVNA